MDKKRILAKLGELASYKRELEDILPEDFDGYMDSNDARRACERLIHIMIETVIDTSALIVKEMELGIPGAEDEFGESAPHLPHCRRHHLDLAQGQDHGRVASDLTR